jgi:hypothetical protein
VKKNKSKDCKLRVQFKNGFVSVISSVSGWDLVKSFIMPLGTIFWWNIHSYFSRISQKIHFSFTLTTMHQLKHLNIAGYWVVHYIRTVLSSVLSTYTDCVKWNYLLLLQSLKTNTGTVPCRSPKT